jgi:hypothetical protein
LTLHAARRSPSETIGQREAGREKRESESE